MQGRRCVALPETRNEKLETKMDIDFLTQTSKIDKLLAEEYMQKAFILAKKGEGRTSPNPVVGAIVVKNGMVVGEGYHPQAGMPHAEIYALNAAGKKAQGATLYVTLEPCNHHGRTPPCTESIINAGITKVVISTPDLNPDVAGGGAQRLREAGVKIEMGVLEKEGRKINEVFFKYSLAKIPFVVLKTAMSLDGKLATRSGDSQWITSEEARRYVHQMRNVYDAIVVGVKTVLRDNPMLTCRIEGGRNPVRIVVDSEGSTPLEARVFQNAVVEGKNYLIIATTGKMSKEKIAAMTRAGAHVLVAPQDKNGKVDLQWLIQELGRRGITSVLVEGGGTFNAAALDAGIVDKMVSFIAPKIIGGKEAPTAVEGEGHASMKDVPELLDVSYKAIGKDIMVEGYFRQI